MMLKFLKKGIFLGLVGVPLWAVVGLTFFDQNAFSQEEAQVEPIREIFTPRGRFPREQFGKVAVVQWSRAQPAPIDTTREVVEAYKQENREELARYIREAARNGAEMVITPEFAVVNYPDLPGVPSEDDEFRNRQDLEFYVEPVPGPTTQYFSALARELGIYIHVGFAEVDLRARGKPYYNTVVALNPDGEIVAKYRKINLYEGENNFLKPGRETVTYDSPFGKVGLLICADVYASNPLQNLCSANVKVLALSTSWAQMNTGMEYFKDAAQSCSAYLLAANQSYFPDSGVVKPDGSLQSHIRQSSGIAYGYLPRISQAAQSGTRTRRGATR